MELYGLWLYATGSEKEEKQKKKSAWIEKKKVELYMLQAPLSH